MDLISLLPVEVAQKIFILLDIKDLYQCMCVCKQWRNLINCNYIWSHFYKIYDIEQLSSGNNDNSSVESNTLSPLCSCALELKRFLLSPAFNWRFGRLSSYYVNFQHRECKVDFCEPYVAVLYLSLNELHIFQCLPKSVKCIDVLYINLPRDSNTIYHPVSINRKYIIVGAYNITLVYKLIRASFRLYKVFASKFDSIICADDGFNDFIHRHCDTWSGFSVFGRVLIDDMLWISDSSGNKHIINLDTGKQDMKQNLPLKTKVVQNSEYVLNFKGPSISITDKNGVIISSFRMSYADAEHDECYMNKSILLICFAVEVEDKTYSIECREIVTGKLIRKLSVDETTRVTLHPEKSILYLYDYIDFYEVTSLCIDTGVILWNYEVMCGPPNCWVSFLSVVSNRFLFVYPAPSSGDFFALFDLKGKLLYEKAFTRGLTLHCSDAVILAREEGRLYISAFYESN